MTQTPSAEGPALRRLRLPALLGLGFIIVVGFAGALLLRARLQQLSQAKLDEQERVLGPERASFRAHKDAEMRGELSPLGRIDYVHLPEGESRLGDAVPLPPGALAKDAAASLVLSGGRLALRAAPAVLVNGTARREAELQSGDVVALGRARLLVAGLPQDPSVAVYDLEAAPRRAYRGLRYFPDDGRYVAAGKLERYERPRTVQVEASRGGPQRMEAVGVVRFELQGEALSLEAFSHEPGWLFLIFKDETNGRPEGSYGAGRFLYARVAAGDQVLLDFNRAWNPLCAYSKYFHCPLPPRQNWLKAAVPVGERDYGLH